MTAPHKQFEKFLEENVSRYTAQKRAIVDEIFKIKTHFEVDEFIADYSEFSRATVYRTIKQLLEGGFIQKISTKDGRVFYERAIGKKQHDHLICNNCGTIIEIKEDAVERYVTEFCDKIGFKPDYRSLHVYGLCQACLNRNTSSR